MQQALKAATRGCTGHENKLISLYRGGNECSGWIVCLNEMPPMVTEWLSPFSRETVAASGHGVLPSEASGSPLGTGRAVTGTG